MRLDRLRADELGCTGLLTVPANTEVSCEQTHRTDIADTGRLSELVFLCDVQIKALRRVLRGMIYLGP